MIKLQCLRPERLRGEYELAGHEDFALWVIANIRGGKTKVGAMLGSLSGKGELITTNLVCDIHATSDFFIKDYFALRDLKLRTGVTKAKVGGMPYTNDPEAAINFAKELDKLAQKQVVANI